VSSASVSCADVSLDGNPISGGASCSSGFLSSFNPSKSAGDTGSLPSEWTATCSAAAGKYEARLDSVYLTCCVFGDDEGYYAEEDSEASYSVKGSVKESSGKSSKSYASSASSSEYEATSSSEYEAEPSYSDSDSYSAEDLEY